MALSFTPNSYRITAPSTSWVSYLDALRSDIAAGNNNTQWGVKQFVDDTTNSGDYGVTLTPGDPSENFDVNIRYDSSDTSVRICVDSDGNISSPLSPNTTYPASPETFDLGGNTADPGYNTEIIVAEWIDAMCILFKNSGDTYFPWGWQFGRIIEPFFDDDPARGLDGMGVLGKTPVVLANTDGGWIPQYSDPNNGAEYKVPGSWERGFGANSVEEHGVVWPSGDETPASISPRIGTGYDGQPIGRLKYCYNWHTPGGGDGLEKIGGTNDGMLFASHNGNSSSFVIPWDPSVSLS